MTLSVDAIGRTFSTHDHAGAVRRFGRRSYHVLDKPAIVVRSDLQAGEEALGRLFNAVVAAYDFKQKHHDVQLVFQGTGTRWTGLLTRADHPAHALYKAVEDKVAGVSSGCADIFGARHDAELNGFSMITTNAVPGTSGLPSLATYASDGYTISDVLTP